MKLVATLAYLMVGRRVEKSATTSAATMAVSKVARMVELKVNWWVDQRVV